MGVEGAVSIGSAVSAGVDMGSAVGEMASGLSGGALVGSFNPAEFAPIVSVSAPVVESAPAPVETPIPSVFLESFAEPVPHSTSEVESSLNLDYTSEVSNKVEPGIIAETAQLEAVRAKLQLAAASRLSPQTKVISENQVIVQSIPDVTTQTTQIEEKIIKLAVKEDREDSETREQTEAERVMLLHVEAEEVSKAREVWIREAGQKAYDEAQKEAKEIGVEVVGIDGQRVGKFLTETEEVISPTRRGKGPDGSLKLTIQEIRSKFYKTVSDVKDIAKLIIPNNRPDKLAKEGNLLEDKEVAKVEERHLFRPGIAKAEVIVTIFKKRVENLNPEMAQALNAV